MPRMNGQSYGTHALPDNASPVGLVRLQLKQARLLPASDVSFSLDTTDRGGPGCKGKRWYRFFASVDVILSCHASSEAMKRRATMNLMEDEQ